MSNPVFNAFDWAVGKAGQPRWSTTYGRIRTLNDRWAYSMANDAAVWDREVYQDRVAEASALLKEDPNEAFLRLRALAYEGSAWSMLILGWCFWTGTGALQNADEAEHWYSNSFDAGCQRALIDCGKVRSPHGYIQSLERLYATGAVSGWAPASLLLAKVRLKPFPASTSAVEEIRSLLLYAAGYGSPEAQWLLARLSSHGRFGLRYVLTGHLDIWKFVRKWLTVPDEEHTLPSLRASDIPSKTIH
jgi:hypothetical protein